MNNLIALLGLLETGAVRVARRHRAVLQRAKDATAVPEPAELKGGASEEAEALVLLTAATKKRSTKAEFTPPSMEGFITHHQKSGDSSEQVVGLGESRCAVHARLRPRS